MHSKRGENPPCTLIHQQALIRRGREKIHALQADKQHAHHQTQRLETQLQKINTFSTKPLRVNTSSDDIKKNILIWQIDSFTTPESIKHNNLIEHSVNKNDPTATSYETTPINTQGKNSMIPKSNHTILFR